MKLVFLVSILFILFVEGCSTKTEHPKNISLPSWYLSKPASTNEKLYGVGSAPSLKESIANALNDISSTILVSVKSTMSKKIVMDNDNYSKKIIEDVKLKTSEITFTNYRIDKSLQFGDNIYTLVEINKQVIYKIHKKKLTALDNKIDDIGSHLHKYRTLEKIDKLQKILPLIKEAKKIAIILTSLNPDFDYEVYYKKYRVYTAELNDLKNNLIIYVKSEKNSDEFSKYFISFLTSNGYKTNNRNYSLTIDIESQNNTSQVNGWYISKVTTTIIVSEDKKIVSSNIIRSLGRSSNSKKMAYSKAAKQFNEKIKALGIEHILFGDS